MVSNKSLIFAQTPKGLPIAGQDLKIEDLSFDPDAAPPAGGITTENFYASYDPYQRGRMRDPKIASYSPPYPLNSVVPNAVVSKVLKSDNSKFKPGDTLVGLTPIQEYSSLKEEQIQGHKVLDNPYNLDLKTFVGALGMPGLTAYSSFYAIGKPQKGETIFISAASGAVGQLVGQLAKHEGLKVIGSVGSDEKLKHCIEDLDFDDCFNYKTCSSFDETLKKLAPDGLDIYYDNVGGEQLEAALTNMKQFGRIGKQSSSRADFWKRPCWLMFGILVACGSVSQYNTPPEKQYGIKNTSLVVGKRLTWRGFIVSDKDMGGTYGEEHTKNVSKWISEGKFKATMSVTHGMDQAAQGLIDMLEGKNFGKAVLDIKGVK
jgi:NADPH-dependent curcumin reductase CurA